MSRTRLAVLVLGVGLAAPPSGPYDIPLVPTAAAPAARGQARLVFAPSPFGVTVTADGRASYDIIVTVSGLPTPTSLGRYAVYAAWAVTPDLKDWTRLGTIGNGTTTVGRAESNKFLLVITAERAATGEHAGPVVMRGYSPSTWLQSFVQHPLFRGVY